MSGRRSGDRRDLAVVGVLWLALTGLAELLVELFSDDRLPVVAAREGRVADDAIVFLLRIVAPVFVFVVVVVVYSLFRFRGRDGDEPGPAQPRDDPRFSWSWVGVTSALTVLVIVYPGVIGINEILDARDAKSPLVVQVTARQWEWRFSYPQRGLADLSELVLPVERPVRFVLSSEDVIHGFWVPAFRIKDDVIPGQTRELSLTPDRQVSTTTSPLARVQCAELCGVGHADMQAPVRVVSAGEFERWAEDQRAA